jgi:hypothetical protein
MAYTLVDTKAGRIGQIASVGGMNDLLDFVQRLRIWGPLNNFLNLGETDNPKGVIEEITLFTPYCTDPNVKDTLLNLKEMLSKAQGLVMIIE